MTTKAPKEQQLRVQGLQVDDYQSSDNTTCLSNSTEFHETKREREREREREQASERERDARTHKIDE
jgi:hypothetical protein